MLLAIDIGNSRIKLGRFDQPGDCVRAAQSAPLPIAGPALSSPSESLTLNPPVAAGSSAATELADWLALQGSVETVAVASVNRQGEHALFDLVKAESLFADANVTRLTNAALPIEVRTELPEQVGIDRLLGAVAANRLRHTDRAAIVVDLGTAITVDLIATDGAFEGGAILPGIAMASRALDEQTDALPRSGVTELDESPDAVGKNTADAIHAGLFWGAVGAVREIIARQSDRLVTPPQVFLTGGAAPSVARLLGGPDRTVRYLPDLVLSGIAIAAGDAGPGDSQSDVER
ncbi:MAG: type III pantothenate kinase [Planctomycetota bacterium]